MTDKKLPLRLFFALSWVHMLWQTFAFFKSAAPAPELSPAFVFHLLTWLSYSAIYLLPAGLLSLLARRCWPRRRNTLIAIAVVASALTLLMVRVDRSIYDLYNFHFNGFVLNLLLTPGGIESLGGG